LAEEETEFERGKEAGRTAQILFQHGEHLSSINGSIDDTGKALRALTKEISSLRAREQFGLSRLEKAGAAALIVVLPVLGYVAAHL
jgi:hypothetical protein